MIIRDAQRLLAAAGYYKGGIDNDPGIKTLEAATKILDRHRDKLPKGWHKWPTVRKTFAAAQIVLLFAGHSPGVIDGLVGHNTREALAAWDYQNIFKTPETVPRYQGNGLPKNSPYPSQSKCGIYYGTPGTAALISQLKMFELPVALRIDWDLNKTSKRVQLHEKCGESGIAIIRDTVAHYGEKRWRELGLDRNAGTYVSRKMRGGTAWSMHAYGCAWDFYAEPNGLRVKSPEALFSGMEYEAFFNIVEAYGWLSLGRAANMDWMHIQATKDLK